MTLLFLYLVSPFFELGIIIYLIIRKENYKRINEELVRRLKEKERLLASAPQAVSVTDSQPARVQPAKIQPAAVNPAAVNPAAVNPAAVNPTAVNPTAVNPAQAKDTYKSDIQKTDTPKSDPFWKQGTLPLVIGVIFIILAGLIFATTTWSRLADIGKVILILAGSITFFGASLIAGKKLHIEKTGKAFYILGSIFLFVTVLSMGHFGILGADFTLTGRYRFFLLFFGIALTDGALFAGLDWFGEQVYAYICLFGITLGVACILGGFGVSQLGFTTGMACYGILAALLPWMGKEITDKYCPDIINRTLPSFASVNLWIISLLAMINMGFGALSGFVTLAMAGVHLYISMKKETGQGSIYACSAFLFIGILRLMSPETVDGWLYATAVTIILLTILQYAGFVGETGKRYFKWAGIVVAAVLFLATGSWSLAEMEVTLSTVICMGILTLDITIIALEHKSTVLNAAWACMLAVFIHYLVLYLPIDGEYQILIMAAAWGVLFFAGQRRPYSLKSTPGDMIFTLLISVDAAILLLMTSLSYGLHEITGSLTGVAGNETLRYALAASAVILILTVVSEHWSRKVPVIRGGIPLIPGLLTLTAGIMIEAVFKVTISFEIIMFVYLILIVVWDLVRKDRFQLGILLIGTLTAFGCFWWNEGNLPYFLLLAGYLMVRSGQNPAEGKTYDMYGICFYILAGTYLAVYDVIGIVMIRLLVVVAVYLIEMGVCKVMGKSEVTRSFFAITGALLYIVVITGYYGDSSLGLMYLSVVLVCFAGSYLLCYHGRFHWMNLVTTLFTLGIPGLLAWRYTLNQNQLYGGVMAAVLISGILFRYYQPVISCNHENKLRIDWYHILVVFVLVPMQFFGNQRWGFFYLLLLGAYTMQYGGVKALRKPAYTITGILCCMAFWSQPFFTWPAILWLEVELLPCCAWIFSLSYIWGRKKEVGHIQTVLYLLCLMTLVFDAFNTQNVVDALLIEGICLAIFLFACQIRCKRWVNLSGGIVIGVAIYLTKGFWLSLSWWVYLLSAGIGLIIFAAVNERKRSEK